MKNTSFERIAGGTDDEKNDLKKSIDDSRMKEGFEKYGDLAIELFEEEKKVISTAVDYVNQISKKYGSNTLVDKNRIFLLKSGGVKEYSGGEILGGVWNSFDRTIAIDNVNSSALLACVVVHEGFHATSYHSIQIDKDGNDLNYRSGIQMKGRNNEGSYFSIAQEAIIAQLSQDFFNSVICKDPLYKDEIKKTNEIKEWIIKFIEEDMGISEVVRNDQLKLIKDIRLLPNIAQIYDKLNDVSQNEEYRFGYFIGYFNKSFNDITHERSEEREKLDLVLNRLISESNGKLRTKEELFDKFTQMHFTGNYLPLAKEIESIFGKGYFRKLAIELGDMKSTRDQAVVVK